jgi:hypothetical protein
MSYVLRMSGIIVGRSALEGGDPLSRTASGELRPGIGYDVAEPIFALYDAAMAMDDAAARRQALDRFTKARDAMRLEIVDEQGTRLAAREARVTRAGRGPSAGLRLEVVVDDEAFWAGRDAGD